MSLVFSIFLLFQIFDLINISLLYPQTFTIYSIKNKPNDHLPPKTVAVGGVDKYVFCGTDADVSPAIQMISWVSVLTYESILLFLALYQSTIIYKEAGWKFKSTELVTVLVKDQMLYFIAYVPLFSTFFFKKKKKANQRIFQYVNSFRVMVPAITNIINFWLLPTQDAAMIVINILASPTIPCIVGSMLMFHLKEAAQRGVNGGTNISINVAAESTMVFT